MLYRKVKKKKSISVTNTCISFSFLGNFCPVTQRKDLGKWGFDELGGVGLRRSERKDQFYSRNISMNSMNITRGGWAKEDNRKPKGKKEII